MATFCVMLTSSFSVGAAQDQFAEGDRLLAINGEELAKKSFFAITALATGKTGTKVKLLVSTAKDETREVIARLSSTQVESVSTRWQASIPVIKIAFFASQTKFDLVNSLERLAPSQAVVLDLRGNPGGDFYTALESADLFIPEGKLLASAIGKDKQTPYRSSGIRKYLKFKLFIWQNHGTASAAEVFTAALTENNRAVSIGENSYGKGTKQNIIELSDGSALILTTEYFVTPNGVKYNRIGLQPTHKLKTFRNFSLPTGSRSPNQIR
jgi:carboxyl-terminal processing protease